LTKKAAAYFRISPHSIFAQTENSAKILREVVDRTPILEFNPQLEFPRFGVFLHDFSWGIEKSCQ